MVDDSGKSAPLKRIHVGGLTPQVTEKELREKFSSFGKVQGVEIKIKKDTDGEIFNSFAYINIYAEEAALQKCFSIFNKAKWKGRTLQIQLAKEHFLKRLEKERVTPEVPKVKKVRTHFHDPLANIPDVENFYMKGKVPGTPIPGQKKWIVGKYGRVLPVVDVKNKSTNKLVHVDPSKYCHNLKKIKPDEADEDDELDLDKLTWEMNTEITSDAKRRRGDFSDFKNDQSKKSRIEVNNWSEDMEEKMDEIRRRYDTSQTSGNTSDTEIEVVKGEKSSSVYHIPKDDFIYNSEDELSDSNDEQMEDIDAEDSAGSADTDEIIARMNSSSRSNNSMKTETDGKLKMSGSAAKVPDSKDDSLSECNGENVSDLVTLDSSFSKKNSKSIMGQTNSDVCYVSREMKMTPFKGMSMLDSSDEDALERKYIKSENSPQSNSSIKNNTDIIKTSKSNNFKLSPKLKTQQYDSESSMISDDSRVVEELRNTEMSSNSETGDESDSNESVETSDTEVIHGTKMERTYKSSTDSETDQQVPKKKKNFKVCGNAKENNTQKLDNVVTFESDIDMDNTVCAVKGNLSDSEYDTDDFEKIAKKMSEALKSKEDKTDNNSVKNTSDNDSENDTSDSKAVRKCSEYSQDQNSQSKRTSDSESSVSDSDDDDSTTVSNSDADTEDQESEQNDTFIPSDDEQSVTDDGSSSEENLKSPDLTFPDKHKKKKKRKINEINDLDIEEEMMLEEGKETEDIVQDKFFVSSSLLNTFTKKQPSQGGFSLLQTFGKQESAEDDVKPSYKLPWQLKSLESEEDEEMVLNIKKKTSKKSDKITYTFFFQPKDSRLQEGIEFFHRKDEPDVIEQRWQEERPRILANCRQRNRLALRRINQDRLKQRKSNHSRPFNSSIGGKKKL